MQYPYSGRIHGVVEIETREVETTIQELEFNACAGMTKE